MPLAPGARLGPYEVVAPIGAGGMGEVYRGRDTRLERVVAIKVLPSALAADPQLRERFEREARAISSLQHPHICALFDVGRDGDHEFLVLEYLEGETVADRLARTGALSVAEALTVAIEVCDALHLAHRSGIVHRDLKPANVMLTKSGAKLLDFGLAKAAAPVVTGGGLSMMPTTPANVTAQGTILGTFQYMAPEQIEGLEADARTDIFAFGALVFEMIAGRPAFEGKTRASLIGAILKDEPSRVSQLQPLAPAALDRIVGTCLAKDPDDRYQSARDLLRDLKWVASGAADANPAAMPSPRAATATLPWVVAGCAALALAAVSTIAVRHIIEVLPPTEPVQFTIAPPAGTTFATPPGGGTGLATQIAISPDGRSLAFVGNGEAGFQLWVRPIGSLDARALPGTEDATFPFWSPDSRYIGFFARGKLKKVAVAGGPPTVLCDALSGRGGTWNRDNVIVFSPSTTDPLYQVSSAGGSSRPVSTLDTAYGESSHRFPSFLPDGRHFIFTGVVGTCCPAAKSGRIRVGTLDSTDAPSVMPAESSAAYASGHLLFNRDGTLMAAPFDAVSLRFAADPFPIAEHVASEGSRYASFSASTTGALVYAGGVAGQVTRLTWFDRSGRTLGTVGEPGPYVNVALSSDERRVAVTVGGFSDSRDIWIFDVARGISARFTFDAGAANAPIWSPDDAQLVFSANREGRPGIRVKRVEGTTNEQLLLGPADTSPEAMRTGAMTPTHWSADGQQLIFTKSPGVRGSLDIWALPLAGDRKPFAVVETPAVETNGVLSPDGRWIAYQTDRGGAQPQIYVQPFPPTGGKFEVSAGGGYDPGWRPDGKEIYFLSQDRHLMAAAVDTGDHFQSATAVPLFEVPTRATQGIVGHQYSVSRNGRFLVNVLQPQPTSVPLTVVLNWLSAVQK